MTKKNNKEKYIVVTGGWGFIGSRFVLQVLRNTNYNVILIDKETYAADSSRVLDYISAEEQQKLSPITKDICDVSLCDFKNAEYIVNFAAESHVDNSIKDGKPFIRSNVEGVFNLLEKARNLKSLKKFVQISTDEVYGDMADLKGKQYADELFTLKPSSYYSSTKASADLLVQSAHRTYKTPFLITRSCNNFGPNQHKEKFLPTVFNSVKNKKEIPVYGDGRNVREWIHVDDNAKILLELTLSESAKNEIFNIGSGYLYKNIEIIDMISTLIGEKPNIKFVDDRLGHDRAYRLSCKKLNKFMGDSVFLPLEGFLKDEIRK